nr:hypothetical protein [Tanacetum cinerariifolium]
MAQENYVDGCSMQRPPLLEPNGFCFWIARFETYVNSKDINLRQVNQNDDFYYVVEDSQTKLMKEISYELVEDDQKKKLGKNNKAKMTLYNSIPQKEYERVFMCKTVKEQESCLKVSSCSTIEMESQDNDGVASKTTKEKVKSLALEAKVTREQTSDDSDSQGDNDENVYEEKEAEACNLMARNFRKGNRFGHDIRFGNGTNRFGRGRRNNFGNKGGESSKQKGACYNCIIECHFASECRKMKENKLLSEEHEAIAKTTTNIKTTQHVSWKSNLKRRLGHANMRLVQNLASNELVRNLPKLSFERHIYDTCGLESQESLKVTFDESLPEPKSSPSIEYDRINEPVVQDLNGSPLLQVNVLDEGYPKCLKESSDHQIEQVTSELNEKTLRSPKSVLNDKAFEDLSNDSDFDVDLYLNDEKDNGDNVSVPQTLVRK